MRDEHLDILAECAAAQTIEPGTVIFRENELADRFFLILDGRVELETRGNKHEFPVQTVGAGEALGWSWLFPPFRWHFEAQARERTRVIVFTAAHLLVACERNHDFGYELMKRVAQVVILRLQSARRHLLDANWPSRSPDETRTTPPTTGNLWAPLKR